MATIWVRVLAMMVAAGLLGGAACTPVYSDRPMGSATFVAQFGPGYGHPSDLNGLWSLRQPGFEERILIAVFDPEASAYRVGRFKNTGASLGLDIDAGQTSDVRLLKHGSSGWLFFSEEDRRLRGQYLWALARQYDNDTFLLWTTHDTRDAFRAMVQDGRLRGRVVPPREGRSSVFGSVRQETVLEEVDAATLDFVIAHRAELFVLDQPHLLMRLRAYPPVPASVFEELRRPSTPASGAH